MQSILFEYDGFRRTRVGGGSGALDREHLLDRKSMVRAALARRLSAVLSATISF